ncbi:MAG: DNA-directed RNA polymerase subunit alpha C-terminal domain-containing protein [Patescibacteria group bacterium]
MREKEESIYPTKVEIPIPYVIKLPENQPYLTEIDCLGLSTRVRNALCRSRIREVAQLPQVISGERGIPRIGVKSREEIRQSLEDFRQLLNKKWAENPGKPVIIEVSPPPLSEKKKEIRERTFLIGSFIRTWQEEHPGKSGALTAAGKKFGMSMSTISDCVNRYKRLTGESLSPKRITDLRAIPISSVDIEGLKRQLPKPLSVEEVMERLTRSVAQRNKDTFPSLSKLARQANMGNLRQLSEIFQELTTAGFHLKKLPGGRSGSLYYYAHREEAEAIVSHLKEKYQAETKIRLLYGPADAPVPTTTEFQKQFVPVFRILKEVTELRLSKKFTGKILEIIFQEKAPIPIYIYWRHYWHHGRRRTIKIPPDYLETFKTQVLAKKEEIISTFRVRV